jgi:hypothetical protein
MKYGLRLLIPVGLAILAAGANFLAMNSATRPLVFVQVTEALDRGKPFTKDNLARLEVPGSFGNLKESAIPFEHVGILYGQPAPRKFQKGDIVFWSDGPEGSLTIQPGSDDILPVPLERVEFVPSLLRVGSEVSFRFCKVDKSAEAEVVGRFRVASVGNQLSNKDESTGERPKMISVAMAGKGQPKRRPEDDKLEKDLDQVALGGMKLVAIIHHPPAPQATGSTRP